MDQLPPVVAENIFAIVVALVAGLLILVSLRSSGKSGKPSTGAVGAPKVTKAKGAKPGASFTVEEVAEHNKAEDLWLIVDGKVYDVTNYYEGHPGGEDAMLRNAGTDVTKGFKGPQHP
eukprot:CAMPEP_0118993064 /NCGR_PEP_ID=MMETSP1173-20130426/54376_1 /TAXON_ID=1034831 /ORGANISM="Rhizochromulina marina cf, Strain CCMP1243" /LENGTH=117 /DNA_ID=CAMNT_0006944289 /DNA_START=1 /DNA_END=351 /DNA_ORIENTATION=+